jgi:hypothetical protein
MSKQVPLTREEAARRGLRHYWTGRPCRKGHRSDRYTSTGQCIQCAREAARAAHQRIVGWLSEHARKGRKR